MSNFDEQMLTRLKLLEREVERLKVKESPGVWLDYTPTVTTTAGTLTTYTASGNWTLIGKVLIIKFVVSLTDIGTGTGSLIVSTPQPVAGVSIGVGRESAVTGKMLSLTAATSSISMLDYSNTSILGNGRTIQGTIVCEVT